MKFTMLPHEYYKRAKFGALFGFNDKHDKHVRMIEQELKKSPPETEILFTLSPEEGIFCQHCPRRGIDGPIELKMPVIECTIEYEPCKINRIIEERYQDVINEVLQGEKPTIGTMKADLWKRVDFDKVTYYIKTGIKPPSFFRD